MKKQTLSKVPARPPENKKQLKNKKHKNAKTAEEPCRQITAQVYDGYLLLDIWADGKQEKRHAMKIETGEYATYYTADSRWTAERLDVSELGTEYLYCSFNVSDYSISDADQELIRAVRSGDSDWGFYSAGCLRGILAMERDYAGQTRENKRLSKERRLRELMDSVPGITNAVRDWIRQQAAGDTMYAFYRKDDKTYHCTACNGVFGEPPRNKIPHKSWVKCPLCGRELTAIRRKSSITIKTRFTIIHNLDTKQGIERHFYAEIKREATGCQVYVDELIRILLLRDDRKFNSKIYYSDAWGDWSEGNRANRRWKPCYLWPDAGDIKSGLQGTPYEGATDICILLAQAGAMVDYNKLLVMAANSAFLGMTEYLFKGRFHRLLRETIDAIGYYAGYMGDLHYARATIEEVMDLHDRQKINRLRDMDGGKNVLNWLRWSDLTGRKISTEALKWYDEAGIIVDDYTKSRAAAHMTPEQLMHYLTRQKVESYPHYKYATIFDQLEDYLDVSAKLGKPMNDALTYRPRELKRRHDEAVEEYNLRRKEIDAEYEARRMREKYPGYEDILQEIKAKYEFGDDTYTILVPNDFADITREGQELHHCVASTERYFDRIVSRETYICFLRRTAEPNKPFYTIEVEPGGTIRQHRGEYDEEPGIEEIKPFLRRWQQEIRRRMSKEDHAYAKKSEELRQQNIDELIAKNNTRVLEGLMEDLMEVI